MIGAALDRALDWAVVPGYTSIGYRLRRRHWDDSPAPDALEGRELLLTGAGSGIGEAASERLAALGAGVHMLGRSVERTEQARGRIAERLRGRGQAAAVDRLEVEACDISDLDAVREFATGFAERVPALDALVHNAGVLLPERRRSRQGHELTFATHVLGPFLLTRLLLPSLERGAPSRVVFVTSGGMYTARLRPQDPELEQEEFSGTRFYAHAKRMQVVLAGELARRERGGGVSFELVHPGWVDTPGVQASLPRFRRLLRPLLRDAGQGADTLVWLLAAPPASDGSGALWHDRRPRPRHRLPWTRESATERERLFQRLSELIATDHANERKEGR